MKASSYNTFVNHDDGDVLVFNSITNSSAKLDKKTYDIYRKIASGKENRININDEPLLPAIKADKKKGGFLIEDDLDEISLIKVGQNFRRFSKGNYLNITIAPTMDCNFDCIYCYECDKKHGIMSREVEDSIIKYVENNLKESGGLTVTWFGGEPLLAIDTICRLSDAFIKIAENKKANYTGTLISNGYLLSKETAIKLKNAKVDGIQITVDGAPDDHNHSRPLKNGSATFDTILQNIKEVADSFLIGIRINIGKSNIDSFPIFLDKLFEYGISEKVMISTAELEVYSFSNDATKDMALTKEEYAKAYVKLVDMAVERGISIHVIERSHMINCSAVAHDGLIIDPDGYLYKCMETTGMKSESIGRIGEKINPYGKSLKWLAWGSAFDSTKCKDCKVMPLCVGGCPRKYLVHDELSLTQNHCSHLKYNLPELMKIQYKQFKLLKNKIG